MPRWLRILVSLFGMAVIGALLCGAVGFGAALFVNNDIRDWRSLGAPPQPAVAVISGDEFEVYVTDVNGDVYVCDVRSEGDCWQPWAGEVPPPDRSQECAPSVRATPPGGGHVDYAYSACFGEFAVDAAYRLRADGGVEVWTHTLSGWLYFLYVIFPLVGIVIGGLVGLIIGLVVGIVGGRRSPPNSTQPPVN